MSISLRVWQRAALTQYFSTNPRDFLAVATPGAGKTTFALYLAQQLKQRRTIERIIVVVPTEHLKVQWASAAARFGLSLDAYFRNDMPLNPSYNGLVATYAQVSMSPLRHRQIATAQNTLVILDEVHHAGDAKSWGDGIVVAYGEAHRRLCLTGTPFRSDDAAIPFVSYADDGSGNLKSTADYAYGYGDALQDGVVRPVIFMAYSGEARWRDNAGEEYVARLGEPLNAEQTARAWRTALDPKGDWIPKVLERAHTALRSMRENIPDAGGLVIASDKTTARAYAKILRELSSTPVTVVLSDETNASQRIADFSRNRNEWLVAVRMVSEGVDVPRLAVGVYATSASTPLFFAQAIGRFVRSRMPGETARVFLPSVPVLLQLASELEVSRDHVLGDPHRPKEGWDDELLEQAQKRQDEKGLEENNYEALSAEAELDSLIYQGATWGSASISEVEQDYLGLPGLLTPDQMEDLLRRKQAEEIRQANSTRRARAGDIAKGASAAVMRGESAMRIGQSGAMGAVSAGGTGAEATAADGGNDVEIAAEVIPKLRKELNKLVVSTATATGRPPGAVHNEARRACGGPPTALCTPDQLRARIKYLRAW